MHLDVFDMFIWLGRLLGHVSSIAQDFPMKGGISNRS